MTGEAVELPVAGMVLFGLLLGFSILFWLLRWFLFGRERDVESGRGELPELPFRWIDFAIFLWAVLSCALLGILITGGLIPPEPDPADEDVFILWRGLAAAVQSAGMQIGALIGVGLALTLIRRRYFEIFFRPDLSTLRVGWISIDTLLRFLPVVWLISGLWILVLTVLREMGVSGIQMDQQEIVQLIGSAEHLPVLLMLGFLAIFIAPVVEELIFRGVIYRFLCQRVNLWFGLIFTNVLFALIHFSVLRFLPLFFMGLLLSWLYEKYKDIRIPIGFHMLFNATSIAIILVLQ